MMKKTLFCFFFCVAGVLPQLYAQVSEEDEAMAYQLKRKLPEDKVAGVLSTEDYEFDIGKGDNGLPVVTVLALKKIQFISLREASSVQYAEFYDRFSSLRKMKQYYKTNNSFTVYNARPVDKSATSGEIFFDDSRIQVFNIFLPRMGLGAMVEVEKKYNDAKYFTRTSFHSYYPIKEKIIRFHVPAWLQLDMREINFAGFKVEKKQEAEGKKTLYTFRMTDLPAVKQEDKALGFAHTWPHLVILVKSFEANGSKQKGFETAADLYDWCNSLYKKCDNQPASFKSKVEELVRGKENDMDKIRSIFYWVQDNIRYIAFEDGYAGFIPSPAQDVYKNKYGDCKGMANLLTEMLKQAGFDAHFTWIGTKHLPYDYSIPSLCVDNHCISALYLAGKTYFLDATEKYVPLGEYAYRIQGKQAMIGKGDQYEIQTVPVAGKDQNKIFTRANFTLNDNILKGHVKVTLTGEERTSFHQFYHDLPTERKKEFLERFLEFGNDNLLVNNVKTSDLLNREIPVLIEGDIDLSNSIIRDEKEIYAGIDFFPRKLSNYTPDDKRMNPYEFNSIYTAEDEIELVLPAGYSIKELPVAVSQQETDYGFSGVYTSNNNKVVLKKTLSINNGTVKKDSFANWKDFLKKLKDFNNNIVVVEKK